MIRDGCLPVARRPQLLGLLPEREARLLRRHCIDGHSLTQIAREESVSPAFTSQLHRRASKRLGRLLLHLLRTEAEHSSPDTALGAWDDWLSLQGYWSGETGASLNQQAPDA